MIIRSEFKPAWWLRAAHGQTIYPSLMRRIKPLIDKTERLELSDGDFLDLSWSLQGLKEDAPLIILLHGLGGNQYSPYVGGFMHAFTQQGWRVVLMHFRGAGAEVNRLARAYHSGDTADFNYVLDILHQREPQSIKAAVGISLGGNVLLKWLGEQGAQSLLATAVAVSVPFRLNKVADKMTRGFTRVYQWHLLSRLRQRFIQKKHYLGRDIPLALSQVEKWQCFWTFDDNVTAPLHGFSNVHAYYRQASCYPYLSHIVTPTLIIHAKDDPFMFPSSIPHEDALSSFISLELSDKGGHVGFISGHIPGRPVYWLETRIAQYFQDFFKPIKKINK